MSGFSTNNKANIPKKTLVFSVPINDIDPLRTLIAAYTSDMPPRLRTFMEMIDAKLGESTVD